MRRSSRLRGPNTVLVDLGGKMVLPGLIDSHAHPTDACMTEFDHPIPEMETIADVLDYIRSRAEALGAGRWVVVRQVFITRLKEQRYPTRDELDRAAPQNPVLFATGPDASVNSLALKLSGIDKDFRVEGPGKVEKDPAPASRPASSATARGTSKSTSAGAQADGARPGPAADRALRGLQLGRASRPSSTATPTLRRSTATAGCTRPAP